MIGDDLTVEDVDRLKAELRALDRLPDKTRDDMDRRDEIIDLLGEISPRQRRGRR